MIKTAGGTIALPSGIRFPPDIDGILKHGFLYPEALGVSVQYGSYIGSILLIQVYREWMVVAL